MARILVVEDDESALDMIREILGSMGHEVHPARNGKTGIDEFDRLRPEVLVTDINLPKKDGIQVIHEARSIVPKQKIIAIAGLGEKALKVAYEAGADYGLAKPFRMKGLLKLIQQCLNPK